MISKRLGSTLLAATLALGGCAGLDPNLLNSVLSAASATGPLDEGTVAAGLKQALEVGTQRTVQSTSQSGGFLLNELIKIQTPEELQGMGKALRAIGFGQQVDELETAMNRAAEKASGEATDIFWNQIKQMSISDAFGILNGGETAATDYFRERTSAQLMERFRPIVNTKMQEVGLYQTYQTLTQAYSALPFADKPALNLEQYVADKSIGGLFTVLAQEEGRIRSDPAARTTDLLKKVFAAR